MRLSRDDNFKNRQGRAAAFTLLELVVVMAILAILTLVAVRSLSGVEDQSRFDATRSQLSNIDEAVLGIAGEHDADGSLLMMSFVGDVGRLPQAVGTDPATQLQELWANPNNLLPLAPRQATSDPDVTLTSGWRGGYLRLGINQTSLQDGWANPYDLLHADAMTPCAPGDLIEIVRSRGADYSLDTASTTGFNAFQYLAFNNNNVAINRPIQNRYLSSITGRVYFLDPSSGQLRDASSTNGDVVVKLFGPDPATGGVAEQTVVVLAGSGAFASVNYSFSNATVGPRVLRAYQGTGIGATAAAGPATFNAASILTKSIPVRFTVSPGAVAKDLVLIPRTAQAATTQPTGG